MRPHAVTSLSNGWSYTYDADGNQTQRAVAAGTYVLTYNLENQLVRVSGPVTAAFGYDGDGKLVTATTNNTTTFYLGNYYEKTGSTVRKYYYHAGRRVAMRENGVLSWHLTDQLGSTAMTLTASAAITGELRYKAYGETRYTYGATSTKYRFTGQREESTIGLYFYNARWYDAALGRFVQADTVVPQPSNPQALNRYSYALDNPLLYTDPTGHAADVGAGQASEEYLWWSMFHPDKPFWWWLWYRASGLYRDWRAVGVFSRYGEDIVRAAESKDISVEPFAKVVRHEASSWSKPFSTAIALAGKDATVGLTEVSVATARGLVRSKELPGPTTDRGLAFKLAYDDRYSIQAGAAAYKQAAEAIKDDLPNLPESLREYYALATYNQGYAETRSVIRTQGVGAFDPRALEYIYYVKQESIIWALMSDLAQLFGR